MSKPAYLLAREALEKMGGKDKWFRIGKIVDEVFNTFENLSIKRSTVDHQIRRFCINRHPTHDKFPDEGKSWKENPIFITDGVGNYRLYDPSRDQKVFIIEVDRDKKEEQHISTTNNNPSTKTTNIPFTYDVINFLEKCADKLGFTHTREWNVEMGRIDLVWFVDLNHNLPKLQSKRIPFIGFELETSWRTRKHIKGDILNLENLDAALGILIMQTSENDDPKKVDGLVKNTQEYIDKQNLGIVIWTDSDLYELAKNLDINLI